MNETYTEAKDLVPGQIFRTSNPRTKNYTCVSKRSGGGRTVIRYYSEGEEWEMNIPSGSSCWVLS